ncbi:type II toxin-antitoxin system HipA family toxin [Flavobacteriales bacterium AH-315-E23]|nr:type II toxin-antitoxin system HipA family toxin [Flavobacteriales bacterium AH-315-E23]
MNVDKLNVYFRFGAQEELVGQLVRDGREILFKYSDDYLEYGSNISPLKLDFTDRVQVGPANPFKGLFGVFADSLPDAWGYLLMKKYLNKKGIAMETLGTLDHLAFVGDNGLGALLYKPTTGDWATEAKEVDLDYLNTNVQEVLQGASGKIIDELFEKGGSPGGARPKIYACYNPSDDLLTYGSYTLQGGYEHWIVKFAATVDANDIANIELAYYYMALDAGLLMSESKLFTGLSGKKYFGTKRFDRIEDERLHMISAAGLLHDDYERSQLDYGILMQQGRELIGTAKVLGQLLLRAAFNIFTHNRDDHSKNFAFLMDTSGQWELAPSYDLLFSSSSQGQHSTTCAGNGVDPGSKELLELAEHFSVKNGKEIIERAKGTVSRWDEFAEQAEVSKGSRVPIGKVIHSLIKK